MKVKKVILLIFLPIITILLISVSAYALWTNIRITALSLPEIQYDGTIYTGVLGESVPTTDGTLGIRQLPLNTTQDMAGEYIGTVTSDNNISNGEKPQKYELYKYLKYDLSAFLVGKLIEEKSEKYILFELSGVTPESGHDLKYLLGKYGANNAENIVSISAKDEVITTDKNVISKFIDYCNNDNFQTIYFSEYANIITQFNDEQRSIKSRKSLEHDGFSLNMKDGTTLYMNYEKTLGHLSCCSVYSKIDEPFTTFLKEEILNKIPTGTFN